MNKLRGLSVPRSIPSLLTSREAADKAASRLVLASLSFFLNLAIALSFLRNFSTKSYCRRQRGFVYAKYSLYNILFVFHRQDFIILHPNKELKARFYIYHNVHISFFLYENCSRLYG